MRTATNTVLASSYVLCRRSGADPIWFDRRHLDLRRPPDEHTHALTDMRRCIRASTSSVRHEARQVRRQVMVLRRSFNCLSEYVRFELDRFGSADSAGCIPLIMQAIADREQQVRENQERDSDQRRQLQLAVAASKGKICVLVRVRPRLASELDDESIVDVINDEAICVDGSKLFRFDRVLGPFAKQVEVYKETEHVVESVMDGFSCSVFSYGATNSGKTYSMEGPATDRGVTYRALQHLFAIRDERLSNDAIDECVIRVSVVEIYNENLVDLLLPEGSPRVALEIQASTVMSHHSTSTTRVPNLTETTVHDIAHLWGLIGSATSNRSTGSTNANEHSSRSHLLVCLSVELSHRRRSERWLGRLALVDLAGSERFRVTGAAGERLRESQCINRSLSCLSNVFRALSDGNSSHIPYRDSKLTFLLQDYLDGKSRVVSIIHVSPCTASVEESLSSLRFAQRVKLIDLGPAQRRFESSDYVKYRTESQEKSKEIEKLRMELEALRRPRRNVSLSPARTPVKQQIPPPQSKTTPRRRRQRPAFIDEPFASPGELSLRSTSASLAIESTIT